jgi:general secretion pathway protein F
VRTFSYKGYDSTGAVRRGLIEAPDLKDARERLTLRGILPETVETTGDGTTGGLQWRRQGTFGVEARVAFYQELSVLLSAGLPLVNALEILMESPELGVSPALLARVRDQVTEGSSLAVALSQAAPEVQAFEKAILEVGEKSGGLDGMLERLGLFLDEQKQLRERIISALIYPSIIMVFALLVAVVMLGFVVPSATAVLAEHSKEPLPALTRFMMLAGRILLWSLPAMVLAAVAGPAYLRSRIARDRAFHMKLDRWRFRLPLVGRGYRMVTNLRCARTLAILLKGGVGIVDALPLAGRSTGSVWIASLMETEANAVRHGSSLADAIRRVPPLALSLPAWIQAGEASGSLEKLLDTAGDAFQHQWNRFVSRALSWLEPVLILLIGLFVLLVTLSVLLPIISMNKMLG